jgi:hypothetical protein
MVRMAVVKEARRPTLGVAKTETQTGYERNHTCDSIFPEGLLAIIQVKGLEPGSNLAMHGKWPDQ